MGFIDKAKNQAEKISGTAKEAVGKHTDNGELEAEGRKDQATADLKNAGEKAKDALSD